jgi:hypothetical protein
VTTEGVERGSPNRRQSLSGGDRAIALRS